jgi:hypothetical protein
VKTEEPIAYTYVSVRRVFGRREVISPQRQYHHRARGKLHTHRRSFKACAIETRGPLSVSSSKLHFNSPLKELDGKL